jgi:hypothetical protein
MSMNIKEAKAIARGVEEHASVTWDLAASVLRRARMTQLAKRCEQCAAEQRATERERRNDKSGLVPGALRRYFSL